MVKVLTVDDMEDITFSIEKSLVEIDPTYEVIKVNNGQEALELANSTDPDIILLDLMMPDMSGWQVLSKLRSNPATKDIPVIIVTAKEDELSKQMGEQMTDAYILKPFDGRDIDRKIKSILS